MHFYPAISFVFLVLLSFSTFAQSWQVQNLSIGRVNQELEITIASLRSPFFAETIEKLSYRCKAPPQFYPVHYCKQGQVTVSIDNKIFNYSVSGWIDLSQQKWNLTFANMSQSLFIKSNSKQKDSIEIIIKNLGFEQLYNMLPIQFDLKGQLSTKVNAQIVIDFSQSLLIMADYQLSSVNYEGAQGDYVMAEANIAGNVTIEQAEKGFVVENGLVINSGEVLVQDIYVLFDDYPINMQNQFKINDLFEVIDIKSKLTSKNDVFIEILSPNERLENITVNFSIKEIKTLYQGFLASYFEILGVDDLEIIGQAKGSIKINNQTISSLELNLTELFMAIESKKINISDLSTQLRWQKDGEKLLSQFKWDELLLAGMPIQASNLEVFTQGQRLWILDDTTIPIFDGSLLINKLALDKIFEPEISIDFSGEVKPISIALITEKMGWPIMNGNISGQIPGMKKVGHSITFDGVLDIDVFDGKMQVENLSIERLFGIAPVIAADIIFKNLNLQQITSTYDFGEITGLINGYVKGLRITNWKADRLDAHLESIKTKGIKQTISQRAIDNISSIGGIQGALSRSFLRFFDYFNYKKIGFGCTLRNSICQMSGINNKQDNYTLIEGRGIPSINIIGFRKFIDWEIFIDRLINAGY